MSRDTNNHNFTLLIIKTSDRNVTVVLFNMYRHKLVHTSRLEVVTSICKYHGHKFQLTIIA